MGLVEVVLEKGFNGCSHDEIKAAYIELFRTPPCPTCKRMDWQGIYNTIYKAFFKLNKVVTVPPGKHEKYYWNPQYKEAIVHIKTLTKKIPVNGNCRSQEILERLYNEYKGTKHEGLILINENYVGN